MTNATKAKLKYNRNSYKRYEFNVGIDTELNYILEEYMKRGSVSNLVKELLCDHFKINKGDIWCGYYFGHNEKGETIHIPNPVLFKEEWLVGSACTESMDIKQM
jgi:hypothetical protein